MGETIVINLHFGFEGIVTIDKGTMGDNGNPTSKERVSKFNNLILDSGLQRIGFYADWMDWLHLGTGITPPHVLQTALDTPTYKGKNLAPLPHTAGGINTSDSQNPFTWITRVFRVTPRGVDTTYTELGIGRNDSTLFSRTLIKDSQGNPSSITVLKDEYLDITYECRMYIPVDTVVYPITPTGDDTVPREITVHASNIGTRDLIFGWTLSDTVGERPIALLGDHASYRRNQIYDGGHGGLFQNPSGTRVGDFFDYTARVRVDDVTAQFSFVRDLPDNVGTIRTIQVSQTSYCFQMEIDPPIVKTDQDRFSFAYQISWGRR